MPHPEIHSEFQDVQPVTTLTQFNKPELPELVQTYRIAVPYVPPGYNDYQPGQCTWFIATLRYVPPGLGNANTWFARAAAKGMATGYDARPGAIATRIVGMHVAYVRDVPQEGWMTISEMNYDYVPYHQRTTTVSTAGWAFIYN